MNKTKLKKLLKYLFIAFLCFNLFNIIRFRWSDAQIAEVEKALRDVNIYECDFSVNFRGGYYKIRRINQDNCTPEDLEALDAFIKSFKCKEVPNTYRRMFRFSEKEEPNMCIEIHLPGLRNIRIERNYAGYSGRVTVYNDFPYYYLIMYERAWASVVFGEAEFDAFREICNVPK